MGKVEAFMLGVGFALLALVGLAMAFHDDGDEPRVVAPFKDHRYGLFTKDGERVTVYHYDDTEWEPVNVVGGHLVLRRRVK